MNKFKVLLSLALLTVACQSKFEEKENSGMPVDAETKKEYQMKSQDILERISKAQDLVAGLNVILQKVKAPGLTKFAISDMIVQIMDSVKASQAEKTKAGYISTGEYYLNVPGVSPECRAIQTRSIYSKTDSQISHSIAVKTCKTGEDFKKLADIVVSEDSTVSVILEQNLKPILPDVDTQQLLSVQSCQVKKDEKRITEIKCQAGDLVLNDNELIQFKKISYNVSQDPVFEASGVMLNQGKPKLDLILQIDRSGKTFSKITPVEKTQAE